MQQFEFACAAGIGGDVRGPDAFQAVALEALDLPDDGLSVAPIEDLRARVESNLAAGRIRTVIAIDEAVAPLERLVRFVADRSQLELILLQVSRYTMDDEVEILVPAIHGGEAQESTRALPTGRGEDYRIFFQRALDRLRQFDPQITLATKAGPRNEFEFATRAARGTVFKWRFNSDGRFSTDLTIGGLDTDTTAGILNDLRADKDKIELEIGEQLDWDVVAGRGEQRVEAYFGQSVNIDSPTPDLDAAREWAIETMSKFAYAFRPRLKQLDQ